MIYQLQEKIRNFQKEPYFEGKAQVIAQNGAFVAKLDPNETQATQEAFEDYLKEKGFNWENSQARFLKSKPRKKVRQVHVFFSIQPSV